MATYHSLDINPVPEKVLYINETGMIDSTVYNEPFEGLDADMKKEDNVRVYVPLDINSEAILRRLHSIYYRYGDLDEDNEFSISGEVGQLISQLEIYDQVWYARGDDAGNGHSKKATKLAKTMIDFLMENEGCAEMFPYDVVQNLSDDYGFDVDF